MNKIEMNIVLLPNCQNKSCYMYYYISEFNNKILKKNHFLVFGLLPQIIPLQKKHSIAFNSDFLVCISIFN